MKLDDSTITRAFAWARAYLAVQNTMAANMCLRRVMKTTVPAEMQDRGLGAVQLAADIASQCIVDGNADAAAELLGFAASWTRGGLDATAGSEAGEEKTVIVQRPVRRLPTPKPPPRPEPAPDEPTHPDVGGRGHATTVARIDDDVTRIYRPGQSRSASGTVITNTIRCARPDVDTLS